MKGRKFTTTWMIGACIAGSLLYWRHHSKTAVGFWTAGFLVGISGALAPKQTAWFERFWTRLTQAINYAISQLLSVLIFFSVLTPVAIIFKLVRRDELKLRKPKSETYWQPHEKVDNRESYRHLY